MPPAPASAPVGGLRRRAVSGVALTTIALALRRALEEPERAAVVVHLPGEPPAPPGRLELHFEPRSPADTWVLVRPWVA